jgi:hypothetical protein
MSKREQSLEMHRQLARKSLTSDKRPNFATCTAKTWCHPPGSQPTTLCFFSTRVNRQSKVGLLLLLARRGPLGAATSLPLCARNVGATLPCGQWRGNSLCAVLPYWTSKPYGAAMTETDSPREAEIEYIKMAHAERLEASRGVREFFS